MKSEEKHAKDVFDEAKRRLDTANMNRNAAHQAFQAAASVVVRETQAVAEAEAAYDSAQRNTQNFS